MIFQKKKKQSPSEERRKNLKTREGLSGNVDSGLDMSPFRIKESSMVLADNKNNESLLGSKIEGKPTNDNAWTAFPSFSMTDESNNEHLSTENEAIMSEGCHMITNNTLGEFGTKINSTRPKITTTLDTAFEEWNAFSINNNTKELNSSYISDDESHNNENTPSTASTFFDPFCDENDTKSSSEAENTFTFDEIERNSCLSMSYAEDENNSIPLFFNQDESDSNDEAKTVLTNDSSKKDPFQYLDDNDANFEDEEIESNDKANDNPDKKQKSPTSINKGITQSTESTLISNSNKDIDATIDKIISENDSLSDVVSMNTDSERNLVSKPSIDTLSDFLNSYFNEDLVNSVVNKSRQHLINTTTTEASDFPQEQMFSKQQKPQKNSKRDAKCPKTDLSSETSSVCSDETQITSNTDRKNEEHQSDDVRVMKIPRTFKIREKPPLNTFQSDVSLTYSSSHAESLTAEKSLKREDSFTYSVTSNESSSIFSGLVSSDSSFNKKTLKLDNCLRGKQNNITSEEIRRKNDRCFIHIVTPTNDSTSSSQSPTTVTEGTLVIADKDTSSNYDCSFHSLVDALSDLLLENLQSSVI